MASINYATREISCKIVYYGPGLSGKTTNLQIIHRKIPDKDKSEMVSLATETDRTLFFDFLPLDLGSIKGFSTKFQLYTVPGQVYYNATRKLVLRGVDGVVFVVDSQMDKLQENLESFANLQENLREYGHSIENIPLVLQYNKRDLPNVYPVEQLNALLNKLKLPHYEAVAATGVGVFTTLKGIGKSVIDKFNAKYAGFQGTRRPIRPGESATISQPIQPMQSIQPIQPRAPVAPPQPPMQANPQFQQPRSPSPSPYSSGPSAFGGPANSNFPPPGSFGAPASPAQGGFNTPPPAFNAPGQSSFSGPISSGFTPASNPFGGSTNFPGNTNFPGAPKPAPINPSPVAPATNPFGGPSFSPPQFGSTPAAGTPGANLFGGAGSAPKPFANPFANQPPANPGNAPTSFPFAASAQTHQPTQPVQPMQPMSGQPMGSNPFSPPAGGIPVSPYVESFGSSQPSFPSPQSAPGGNPIGSPANNALTNFPPMPPASAPGGFGGAPLSNPFSSSASPFSSPPTGFPSGATPMPQPGNAFPGMGNHQASNLPPVGQAFPSLNKSQGPFPTLAVPEFKAKETEYNPQSNPNVTGNMNDTGSGNNTNANLGASGSAGNPGGFVDRSGIVTTYEDMSKEDAFKTKKLPHPTEKKKGFFDGLFKKDK